MKIGTFKDRFKWTIYVTLSISVLFSIAFLFNHYKDIKDSVYNFVYSMFFVFLIVFYVLHIFIVLFKYITDTTSNLGNQKLLGIIHVPIFLIYVFISTILPSYLSNKLGLKHDPFYSLMGVSYVDLKW